MRRKLTVEDCLKSLAKHRQKKRFMHKTSYGSNPTYTYNRKAHEEHYRKIKNTPYDMRVWEL